MPNNSTSEHSPNSQASWPAEAFPLLPTLGAAVGLAVVYVGSAAVLLAFFHVAPASVRQARLTVPMSSVQLLTYVPVLAYVAAVLPKLSKRSLGEIFGPGKVLLLVSGALASFLMFFAVTAVGALQTVVVHEAPHQLAVRLFQNARPGIPVYLMALSAIVIGPIVEELVFRGWFFNWFHSKAPFWPAAIASGLWFGTAHGEPAGILPLAAGGIVLAWVYARTGSLWASAFTHGTFNGMTLWLVLFAGVQT